MKIKELFAQKRTVLSLEVFPPKLTSPVEVIYQTLEELKDVHPDFISVTYGAGGQAKDRTLEIAAKIKREYGIESLAHLTCISSTQKEVLQNLQYLTSHQIENVLALRGDLPEDPDFVLPDPLQYEHASDLVREIRETGGFSIGAACYPEGHVGSKNRIQDIKHLRHKVDQGVDFLITQLFFDNEVFFRYMDELDLAGIHVPVSAGIMPVLNKNQILRITKLSGCEIPKKFQRILDRYEHDPASLKEAGEAYAIGQIIDLLAWGVSGIHLYTMNRSDTAQRIMSSIGNIRKTHSSEV